MPLLRFIKHVERSLGSYFGVWDDATEQKVVVAEELAKRALELADDEFKVTRNVDNLHDAAFLLQQAIHTIDKGYDLQTFKRDKALSGYIHDLKGLQCLNLRKLYFETEQAEFLDECIDTLQQTYIYAPKKSRTFVAEVSLLSQVLFDRYFAHGEQEEKDRHDARKFASLALSSQPNPHSKEQDEFDSNALERSLEDARQLLESPIEITRSSYLLNRGCSLMRQFERCSKVHTLQSARSHLATSLGLLPPAHPNYAKTAIQVTDCEVLYIQRTNDINNLESTLTLINTLDLSCCSPERSIGAYISKSTLYRRRFEHVSDIADLDHAIESAEKATRLETLDLALQVQALTNLGHQFGELAQFRLSLKYADAAIDAFRRALIVCPEHHIQQRANTHMELAAALVSRYTLFGGVLDLTVSLQSLRQAATVSLGGNAARATRLHNLAYTLKEEFSVSGSMSVLEECIHAEREALSITSDDDPQKCAMLDGLSGLLLWRFQRTHNSEDLDDAVLAAEEALAKTSEGEQSNDHGCQTILTRID
jgi:tetratricopeptide (TPR) repeat protein